MTEERICQRALIKGRVQGVGYRYSTQEKARSLDLSGWVRNLVDGRVETIVIGEPAAVEVFIQWLHTGPPAARVDLVEVETHPLQQFEGFSIYH